MPKTPGVPASRARRLPRLLGALRTLYGKLSPPAVTEPFEQIVFENVAYLATDARREKAFRSLKEMTGLRPEGILAAPRAALLAAAAGGILPGNTVEKLREIATIAIEDLGGDVGSLLRLPPQEARKALKKFPSIGDPGAEKILLLAGAFPVLALDSNGLRVLLRIGFGKQERGYAKSYRSAQAAAQEELPKSVTVLIEAHQLLRRHGQELCKTSHPRCEFCPLRPDCVYYRQTPPRPVRRA